MDAGLIIRAFGIGITVAVAAQILNKSGRDDQATLVAIAGIVTMLLFLVGEIGSLFESIREIFGI